MKEKKAPEKKEKKQKKPLTKKQKVLLWVGIPVGVIALLVLAAYIGGSLIWGKLHYDPADTAIKDNTQLAAILREDINAKCEGYLQEDIDKVRSSIVLGRAETLPYDVDYEAVFDLLTEDINADLSEYADLFNEEEYQEISLLRWIVYYECTDLLLEREPQETIAPPDYETTGPDGETTGPDGETTGPDGETTGPDGETTGPDGETTGPDGETTGPDGETSAPTTTSKPKPTDPPVTTPKDPTVSVVTPGTEPTPETGDVTVTDGDVYNLLVIGVDTRGSGFTGRSDTIMVVSINKASKRIVLTSFMRDTIIKDPELGGYAKINNFYARSASSVGQRAGRLMSALKYNFGMEIHNYVVINFKVFNQIIDIFGGVDVPLYYSEYLDLKDRLKKSDSPLDGLDSYFDKVPGGKKTGYITVHLDSKQALLYARIRSNLWNPVSKTYQRSDDSYRTERQRNVVMGLIRKMRTMSFDDLMTIANEVLPMVATGISYNEFLALAADHMDYAKYTMDTLNATKIRYAWYPCTTDGYKVYFQGDKGYGKGYSGVGILEPPYTDGYKLIRETWRNLVYR